MTAQPPYHASPPGWTPVPTPRPKPKMSPWPFVGIGAALLTIVGCFGPWVVVTVGSIASDVNGMQGDGPYMLLFAMVVAALMAVAAFVLRGARWPAVAAASSAAVCLIFAIIDVVAIRKESADALGGFVEYSIGWGLILVVVAAVVMLGASIAQIVTVKRPTLAAPSGYQQPGGQPRPGQQGPWSV